MFSSEEAIFSAIVSAPFGRMGIRTENASVSELVYLPERYREKSASDAVAENAARQVQSYFADPDFIFELPLKNAGTLFQQKVWKAISDIPRGEIRTYGQLAKSLRSAPRAVGQACGANWFPLIIPCHRVTAAGGIGGFAHHDDVDGFHIRVKRFLLEWESAPGYASIWSGRG